MDQIHTEAFGVSGINMTIATPTNPSTTSEPTIPESTQPPSDTPS